MKKEQILNLIHNHEAVHGTLPVKLRMHPDEWADLCSGAVVERVIVDGLKPEDYQNTFMGIPVELETEMPLGKLISLSAEVV